MELQTAIGDAQRRTASAGGWNTRAVNPSQQYSRRSLPRGRDRPRWVGAFHNPGRTSDGSRPNPNDRSLYNDHSQDNPAPKVTAQDSESAGNPSLRNFWTESTIQADSALASGEEFSCAKSQNTTQPHESTVSSNFKYGWSNTNQPDRSDIALPSQDEQTRSWKYDSKYSNYRARPIAKVDSKTSWRPDPFTCNVLHIGLLPQGTSETELRDLFSDEPGFSRVFLQRDYCFIDFVDTDSACAAREKLKGVRLKNSGPRGITINFSRSALHRAARDASLNVERSQVNLSASGSEHQVEEAKAADDSVSSQASQHDFQGPIQLKPSPVIQIPNNIPTISSAQSSTTAREGDQTRIKDLPSARDGDVPVELDNPNADQYHASRPSDLALNNSPRRLDPGQYQRNPNPPVKKGRKKDSELFKDANAQMKLAKAESKRDPGLQPWDSDSLKNDSLREPEKGFEDPYLWIDSTANPLVDWDGNLAAPPLESERGAPTYHDPGYTTRLVHDWRKKSDMNPQNIEIANDELTNICGEIALPEWDPREIEDQTAHEWWQSLQETAFEECGVTLPPFWKNRVAPKSAELNGLRAMEVHVDPEGVDDSTLVATQVKIDAYCRKMIKMNVGDDILTKQQKASDRGVATRNQRSTKAVANIYIRPAEVKDLPQIAKIWNSYIQNTVFCPERDLLPDDVVHQRWEDVQSASLPWLVAVTRSRRSTRMNRGRYNAQKPEMIAGFAFADDFNDMRGMYRYTVELELYIKEGFLRQGVGRSLMDRILHVLDPVYQPRGGYDFICEGPRYGPGGSRTIGNIIVNVPYASGDESRIQWITEWLARWEFGTNGWLFEVGHKLSSIVNLTILSRKTGVRLDGDAV